MSQKSIKYPTRFLGLLKSRRLPDCAMSARWHGQKGHHGFTPNWKGLLKREPQMSCRAPSICAPVIGPSKVAGSPMLNANWGRGYQSAPLNWRLSVSFWGKTSTASWQTEGNRGLAAKIATDGLLPALPNDTLIKTVII